MRGRDLVAAAFVLFALATAASCGGGGSGDGQSATEFGEAGTTSAETIPKSDFVAQANAVCVKRRAAIKVKGEHIFKQIFNSPPDVGAKRLVNEVIAPGFEAEVRELKEVGVPDQGANQVDAVYKAIEDVVKSVKSNPKAQGYYPYNKAAHLAAAYGLPACGHP